MPRPDITRTYGPIHFEDLDPKRFEDLIRQLVYDFKDWNTIEATGRGGADNGFDIRAYEKTFEVSESEDGLDDTHAHPMDGRIWMIQCKREQDLGPTRINKIIKENINSNEPPYGYILATSANISKKSHDAFRNALIDTGVMEFYLWGKASLEDLLYQPKNDRILFTFFGISLASRRRSRTTELRSVVTTKNKLFTILGNGPRVDQQLLVRDVKDDKYPFEDEYTNFEQYPRWLTLTVEEYHPRGLVFKVQEYYAYVDQINKQYDYWAAFNLSEPEPDDDENYSQRYEFRSMVIERYNTLPQYRKGYYTTYGLIRYSDIALIDAKGDQWNNIPHIYVDFVNDTPFKRLHPILQVFGEDISVEEFNKIEIFPTIVEPLPVHSQLSEPVTLSETLFKKLLLEYRLTLFAANSQYAHLTQFDKVKVIGAIDGEIAQLDARVNYVYQMKADDYLKENQRNEDAKAQLIEQLGNSQTKNQLLYIYELEQIF